MRGSAVAVLVLLFLAAPTYAGEPAPQEPKGSLDAAPELRPGEWWQVQVVGALADDWHEATLVVAAKDAEGYLIGMPAADFVPALLSYHMPAVGRVAHDLSYRVHNDAFEPVNFPLAPGASWKTHFAGWSLAATVESVVGDEALIRYRTAADYVVAEATYDASLHALKEVDVKDYGRLRVLDHGYGYGCLVKAPARIDMLFYHQGTPAVAESTALDLPKIFDVTESYDGTALYLLAGGHEGAHAEAVVDPTGALHEVAVGPRDMTRYAAESIHLGNPRGKWHFDGVVGEGGISLAEAVGYTAQEVRPEARVPAGENADAPGCDTAAVVEEAVAAPTLGEPRNLDYSRYGFAALGLAGLAVGFWNVRLESWRRLLLLPFLPLFAKLSRERVLNHPIRREILELVRADPGVTTQEIRRKLEIGWGTAVHHVLILERHGILVAEQWGRNRDWFLADSWTPRARLERSALKREAARIVFEHIEKNPGVGQQELARQIGVHHATILFHVRRLEKAQLVECRREGPRARYFPLQRPSSERPVVTL